MGERSKIEIWHSVGFGKNKNGNSVRGDSTKTPISLFALFSLPKPQIHLITDHQTPGHTAPNPSTKSPTRFLSKPTKPPPHKGLACFGIKVANYYHSQNSHFSYQKGRFIWENSGSAKRSHSHLKFSPDPGRFPQPLQPPKSALSLVLKRRHNYLVFEDNLKQPFEP